MNERYDVAVIGAGIVGVSTALHLHMRGKKVALIDRRGAGQETSYGNGGVIGQTYILPHGFPSWKQVWSILRDRNTAARIHYANLLHSLPWIVDFFLKSQPQMRRLNGRRLWPLKARSVKEHRVLMRIADAGHYLSPAGRVALYRSEASFAADALERNIARETNVNFEIMSAAAFREIEPHLHPVYHKAVQWLSSARITNPGGLTSAYAEKFVRDGGTFLQTEVRALNPVSDDLWNIETRQGDVQAGQVVICAGPWAMEILKPLGYRFPLGIKRGYHQHFAATGAAVLSHTIYDGDYSYVIAPMEQGYRLVSGVEFAGLHAPPTPVQIERILPRARELFPLGEPLDAPWCGSRPCFPDSLPIIGAAPKHAGLWLNIGHGHLGLMIGPPSGRLLVEMMMGDKPFCDPTPYRATRFNC